MLDQAQHLIWQIGLPLDAGQSAFDGEHRLVYSVDKTGVTVHQCRYHY